MQGRQKFYGATFAGHAGNNFVSEAVLSTGAVDAVISEFNCTLPGIEAICDSMDICQICLDAAAKKTGSLLVPYNYDEAGVQAEQILEEVLEAYKRRRSKVELRLLNTHGYRNCVTGVSELNLKAFLGGSWEPLLDLIKSGAVKGIAGVVGCSSLADGHDTLTDSLTRELIQRDILVLTGGCTSGGLANIGLTSPEAAELAGDSLKSVCKKLNIPPVLNFGSCLAIGRLELVAVELSEMCIRDRDYREVIVAAGEIKKGEVIPRSKLTLKKIPRQYTPEAVSYTHLDVYKRQGQRRRGLFC